MGKRRRKRKENDQQKTLGRKQGKEKWGKGQKGKK